MSLDVVRHHDQSWGSFEEAMTELPKIEPRHEIVNGRDMTFTPDLRLFFGQNGFKFAESGVRAMFKLLKIPFHFGTEILPSENMVNDVNSLLQDSSKNFMILIRGDDETVVGFTSEDFTPVRYTDLLRVVNPPSEAMMESVRVNDENMVVNIVKHREIEPIKGDISKVGNRLQTSNTGFGNLSINTLIFRLVCANGATVSKEYGGATFSLRGRASRDILTDGMMFVNQAVIDVEHIASGLDRMVQLPIGEMRLPTGQRFGARVPALELLPVRVREVIGKEQTEHFFKDTLPETPSYNIYNNITQAAQRYDLKRRSRMEQIGGSLLSVSMHDVRAAA